MKKKEEEALKYFLKAYQHQWKLNQTYRDQYDDDLEYYTGYRNESDYPLAYNMTFPQLLPRIMTMLSRMLEQLYQGSTHNLVSVRPRTKDDVERAPRVQGLLNYQLETLNDIDADGSSYLFNFQWMCNALSWGKGIAKMYWRKEERISPRRVAIPVPMFENGRLVGIDTRSVLIQDPQIVYDAPYAEVLHNKLFVPHPHYKNIQQMPFVFCVYRKTIEYIKQKQREGIYRNIKDLGYSSSAGKSTSGTQYEDDSVEAYVKSLGIEGYVDIASMEDERLSPEVDIVEGYGRYIFPEDDAPYEVGSGVKIKGKESEAIVHIGNYKSLLSLQKNTYGKKPFFAIGAYMHPELFWDLGIIRLGKAIQEQYDTLANTRFQNALMSVNSMLLIDEDADIPPEALIWKPYGLVPGGMENGRPTVQPLVVPDTQGGVFREQEEFFKSTIEDMTGMYSYNMGATPTRQENVGTIYSLQAMGEARTKLLLMTMDYQGFQPLLKHMMLLNTWHLPDKFETRITTNQGKQFVPMFAGDIHPNYDFSARYTSMEPAMGKQFRAQQLIQYAQMWQNSPYLQQHEFMKAIMELMDFHDSDKYLKSPQQVMQEQQQAVQQAVQAKMMEAQMQDKLAEKDVGRAAMRDVAKGLLK